jgi:hypothetical protein
MSLKTRKPVSSAPSEAALRADFNERILRSSHLDKISRKWEGVRVLAIADARLCGEKHLYILVPEFLATMQEHGALNGSLAIRLEVLKQHVEQLCAFGVCGRGLVPFPITFTGFNDSVNELVFYAVSKDDANAYLEVQPENDSEEEDDESHLDMSAFTPQTQWLLRKRR